MLTQLALRPEGPGQWPNSFGRGQEAELRLLREAAPEPMLTDGQPSSCCSQLVVNTQAAGGGGLGLSLSKRQAAQASVHCVVLEEDEDGREVQHGREAAVGSEAEGTPAASASPPTLQRNMSRGLTGEGHCTAVQDRSTGGNRQAMRMGVPRWRLAEACSGGSRAQMWSA